MVLEIHMRLCVTEPNFLEKKIFAQKNWENGPKMDQKLDFLNLLNLSLLILFYDEIFYYLLCSCTNPIFGKSLRYRPN